MSLPKASPELLREWTLGYDLDCGGYEFSAAEEPLAQGLVAADVDEDALESIVCLETSGGELDYIFGERINGDILIVNAGSGFLPDVYEFTHDGALHRYRRVDSGELYETDRECHCHGQLQAWTGAAGEPKEPLPWSKLHPWLREGTVYVAPDVSSDVQEFYWECTGSVTDKPYPDCTRCEGEGYVTSPGGTWAVYKEVEVDEEDANEEPEDE